jgi:hypothetical protein
MVIGGGLQKELLTKTRVLQILFVNDQGAENSVIVYVWDGTDAIPAYPNPL